MYLALPKGPLSDEHILIIPIQHEACTASLSTVRSCIMIKKILSSSSLTLK